MSVALLCTYSVRIIEARMCLVTENNNLSYNFALLTMVIYCTNVV